MSGPALVKDFSDAVGLPSKPKRKAPAAPSLSAFSVEERARLERDCRGTFSRRLYAAKAVCGGVNHRPLSANLHEKQYTPSAELAVLG